MTQQAPQDEILTPIERSGLGLSLSGGLLGLVLGVLLGLFYAWQIDPVIVTNTAPADLDSSDKRMYIAAIAQEYGATGDLQQAVTRLLDVEPDGNPFEVAANAACGLMRSGDINHVSDTEIIRSLRAIYEPQGIVAECDISAFNTPVPVTIIPATPTPSPTTTITPVATKTPTPQLDPGPLSTPLPTHTPVGVAGFRQAFVEPFCTPGISGIIEIYVRDANGAGLPGIPVEVIDSDRNRAVFFTGLKPERGDDYADFAMAPDERYRVGVVDAGQPTQELAATPCDEVGTLQSYRVVLQRIEP
ncbi:MAG: hypothetical protein ACLFTK_02675 [Anaerolineales bacterium]